LQISLATEQERKQHAAEDLEYLRKIWNIFGYLSLAALAILIGALPAYADNPVTFSITGLSGNLWGEYTSPYATDNVGTVACDDIRDTVNMNTPYRMVTGRNAHPASEETEPMATASPRTAREVVDFPPNTPITVALKYGQSKTVSSQYGERIMYSLADGPSCSSIPR
jgi:hypothetical protein